MHEGGHVDSATLRGARIVGVVCAVAFFAPIVLSLVFPAGFFYRPFHPTYERMIGAILLALGLGLLLALRDPARNAGVYAVIGLVTGSMAAARSRLPAPRQVSVNVSSPVVPSSVHVMCRLGHETDPSASTCCTYSKSTPIAYA